MFWEKTTVRIEILIEQEEINRKTILFLFFFLKENNQRIVDMYFVFMYFEKVEKDIQQISNIDDSREVRLDGVTGKKEGSFYFALL